jgi:dTDP-4-amino-4,6-dideoxygalactose transaminase
MEVPFLDLRAQHEPLLSKFIAVISEVIDSGAFAGGPFVEKFEQDFAEFCSTRYGLGVGSGTEALWFALLASGIQPGDEVITVPSTFMATAEAITFCGAKPVFVDVEESTYTINPSLIEKAITSKTKAIIPVHLFGQMADMDGVMEVARKHGLIVIEDACQAHGATWKGQKAGSIGHAGCFSFYPGKNLGAFGEAGAIVTHDRDLAEKVKVLRDHGQVKKYYHSMVGWNGRMDGLQAGVLRVKLSHLAKNNECRRENARMYHSRLEGLQNVRLPMEAPDRSHVYHIYAIRVQERDSLMRYLREKNIGCGIHYPVPIHRQQAYGFLGLEAGSFPIAEHCADEFVSLPMFPELSSKQIDYVATSVREWLTHESAH